jgi:hypothetical protein
MSVETIWHQFLLFRIRLFWSSDRYRYQYEVSENKLRKKRTRLTQIKFSAKERTNTYWLFRLSPNFLSIHSFNLLSKQISIFLSFFLLTSSIFLTFRFVLIINWNHVYQWWWWKQTRTDFKILFFSDFMHRNFSHDFISS